MILVRVNAPTFIAGFELDEESDRVVNAAPILRWTRGMTRDEVRAELARPRLQGQRR